MLIYLRSSVYALSFAVSIQQLIVYIAMRPTLLLVHIFHSIEAGLWTEISFSVVTVWHHERKYWSRNNCLGYTVFDIISAHALISAHPVHFEKYISSY